MRKAILYGVIIFQVLIIISLFKGVQISKQASLRIATLEQEKQKLQSEQEKIKQEAEYVESSFYLEKVAREELHLSKPGESIVIIPKNSIPEVNVDEGGVGERDSKPNWQKWWEILSGKIQ